jgi:hypothetical protein
MRIWFREWKNSHMIQDTVIEDYAEDTRTHKIMNGLEAACHELDLSVPIWLQNNISDFQRSAKTRFRGDNFIDEVPFDYLEMQIIEEDW